MPVTCEHYLAYICLHMLTDCNLDIRQQIGRAAAENALLIRRWERWWKPSGDQILFGRTFGYKISGVGVQVKFSAPLYFAHRTPYALTN